MPDGKTFFWKAEYHNDLNSRTTLDTQLNVLESFQPKVPQQYTCPHILLLGNLHPDVQWAAMQQMQQRPKLIILDTMNFWMEHFRPKLDEVIANVDVISINDEEARQLTAQHSLVKAAAMIHAMGPKYVIIKKGEHGALLLYNNHIFCAPALPLEEVFDPTGAGDSFAGALQATSASLKTLPRKHEGRHHLWIGDGLVHSRKIWNRKHSTGHQAKIDARLKTFEMLTKFDIELE